jgi:hypothetical protein
MQVDAGFLSYRFAMLVDTVKSRYILSSFLFYYFLHLSSFIVSYAPTFCTEMPAG